MASSATENFGPSHLVPPIKAKWRPQTSVVLVNRWPRLHEEVKMCFWTACNNVAMSRDHFTVTSADRRRRWGIHTDAELTTTFLFLLPSSFCFSSLLPSEWRMLRTKQLFIHFLVGCSSPILINLGCVCADCTLLSSFSHFGGGGTAFLFALILHNCCRNDKLTRECLLLSNSHSQMCHSCTCALLRRPFSRFGWRKRFKTCEKQILYGGEIVSDTNCRVTPSPTITYSQLPTVEWGQSAKTYCAS